MSFIKSLFLFVFTLSLLVNAQAGHADPKPSVFFWWPSHWINQDFRPHIDHPTIPHNTQWDADNWVPQDWLDERGSPLTMLEKLYVGDFLREVDEDGNLFHQIGIDKDEPIPVLCVGQAFFTLSDRDKRRVIKFVDFVYNFTGRAENGTLLINFDERDDPIGVYTKFGLQLQ